MTQFPPGAKTNYLTAIKSLLCEVKVKD